MFLQSNKIIHPCEQENSLTAPNYFTTKQMIEGEEDWKTLFVLDLKALLYIIIAFISYYTIYVF